jgi:predicted secreted Zn-dependent protease
LSRVVTVRFLKIFLILQLFVFLESSLFAQSQKIPRILLTWNSFRKTASSSLAYIAYTAHKTFYKYRAIQKGNNVNLKFEVRIMLDTPNTVVNYRRLQNLTANGKWRLLKHEQGHSDLAVVYGRMLYKELSSQTYAPNDFKTKTRAVYLRLMKSLADENRRYDVETEHGFNQEKQRQWAIDIAERL